MPEYSINKLVRNNYPEIYKNDNQYATFKKLNTENLKNELTKKIIEEANEMLDCHERDELISELADIKQVIGDFERLSQIQPSEVEEKRLKKEQKLGGFTDGVYVQSLILTDNDKWNDYYRKHPNLYPEK